MLVNEMLKAKRTDVVTVKPHETLNTLVHRLTMENIGAVVVSTDGGKVDGIISERDIVRGLTRHGAHLLEMTVAEIMTEHVLTCSPNDNIKDIMRQMTQRRIRHLPVAENGRLMGLVSIGDVVKDRLELMELEANVLRDQLVAHT